MSARARIEALLGAARPSWSLQWIDEAELRSRTHGCITNAHGTNPRTHKPERGGVLCCRVFGPVEALTCLCTKYSGEAHRGITCEKCGVLVTDLAERSTRMGLLELPPGLVHPWAPERPLGAVAVLPAGLREPPLGHARDELPGTSGLYQRLVRHGHQLERCVRHYAPSLIVEHETTLTQRALARTFGMPRARPGRGPTLAEVLQRALDALEPGDEALPPALQAMLAVLGLEAVSDPRTTRTACSA